MSLLRFIFLFYFFIPLAFSQVDTDVKRPYLNAPVFLDGEEVGVLWVYPEYKGNELLVETLPIIRFLSPYIEDKQGIDRIKNGTKGRFVTSGELESLGVISFFDEQDLLLRITIRPHIRTQSKADISEAHRSVTIVPQKNASVSGYANFYLNQSYSDYGDDDSFDRDPFYSNVDTVLNLNGIALISGGEYHEGAEKEFTRKDSWAEYDFQKIKSRLSVGEVQYTGKGLQVEGDGLGAVLSNVVSLNPQTLSRSTDSYSVTLKRPSIVEVLVNGTIVHRGQYPAGPLDLSNFPFVTGNNSVELKVTDDQGRIEISAFNRLFDSELLAEGLFEYSVAQVNPYTVNDDGDRNYERGNTIGSYFVRYGLSSHFTLGLNAQYDRDYKLVGAENSFLLPFGTVENHLASSYYDDQGGIGAKVTFRTHEQQNGRSLPFYLRTNFDYKSIGFRQFQQVNPNNKFTLAQTFGTRIGPSSSVGSTLVFRDNYLLSNEVELRADYRQTFFREYNSGISFSNHHYSDGRQDFRFALNLSWYPHFIRTSITSSYDSADRDGRISVRGQNSLKGMRANYLTEVGRKVSGEYVTAEAQLSGSRGEIGTRYNFADNEVSGKGHSLSLDSRFSLAFAGSSFAFGRTISDSFAIVSTKPSINDVDIPLFIGRSPIDSSVDIFGPALITEVDSYQYREISFDRSNISEKYLFDREHFSVFPTNKRGTSISTNVTITTSVVAQIFDDRDRPLSYAAGDIVSSDDKLIGRFFSNRKGRIYLEKLVSGKYFLKLDDSRYAKSPLNVAESAEGIIKYGKIHFSKGER